MLVVEALEQVNINEETQVTGEEKPTVHKLHVTCDIMQLKRANFCTSLPTCHALLDMTSDTCQTRHFDI